MHETIINYQLITVVFCLLYRAKNLKNVPTANDIRYHLKKIDNFDELETQINQVLKSRIPLGLKNNSLKIAKEFNTLFMLSIKSAQVDLIFIRIIAKDLGFKVVPESRIFAVLEPIIKIQYLGSFFVN